jgi:hypothetical protein
MASGLGEVRLEGGPGRPVAKRPEEPADAEPTSAASCAWTSTRFVWSASAAFASRSRRS